MTRRGYFIVIEGGDRAGKSTQAKALSEYMQNKGHLVEMMKYPGILLAFNSERVNSLTGPLIQNYLSCKNQLSDEAIHLIFSANRWELQ